MKITKSKLKRIIKEEKQKLLRESGMSVSPMRSRADAEFARIIKEQPGQYGLKAGDKGGNDTARQLALDHLQRLDDALYNAGIEVGMGQLRGIVMDALDRGGY